MWKDEVTIKTNANREQVWELWSDVKNWNMWDKEVESSKIFGNFEVGVKGVMKPKSGPKAKFNILSCTRFEEFTSRSYLPFATIDFIHELTERNGQLYITHKVEISGALTFLFSKVIGKKVITELPKAMQNLSQMAKKL